MAANAHSAMGFLELPLEVRLNLYHIMLSLPVQTHLNLLCVNKQVYSEARKSFYQRPLVCNSQYDLMDFVEHWPKSAVHNITNLQLHLEEIRPEAMQGYLAELVAGTQVQRRHPYLLEIQQITTALSALSGVTHLQILKPLDIRTGPPSSIVTTQVLRWAADYYTKLHSLRLDIEQCHLDCLESCKELKSLRLSAYSESSPTRMADVLRRLPNLKELSLAGPPSNLAALTRHGYHTRIAQSITHVVISRMRPLKRLSIFQLNGAESDPQPLLTPNVMIALYQVHRDSLRELKISSAITPTPMFVTHLAAFLLGTTTLEEVSLLWPNTEPASVDNLPNTVRKLEIAVRTVDQAQVFVQRLSLMRYRLPWLRTATFHLVPAMADPSRIQSEQSSTNTFSSKFSCAAPTSQ
jgi:hypothetical protein